MVVAGTAQIRVVEEGGGAVLGGSWVAFAGEEEGDALAIEDAQFDGALSAARADSGPPAHSVGSRYERRSRGTRLESTNRFALIHFIDWRLTHHARQATETAIGRRSPLGRALEGARPVLSRLKAAKMTPAMAEIPLRRARGLTFLT